MVCLEELYLFRSEWCGLFLFFCYTKKKKKKKKKKKILKATSFMKTEGIT